MHKKEPAIISSALLPVSPIQFFRFSSCSSGLRSRRRRRQGRPLGWIAVEGVLRPSLMDWRRKPDVRAFSGIPARGEVGSGEKLLLLLPLGFCFYRHGDMTLMAVMYRFAHD